jgi:hypothetical protein
MPAALARKVDPVIDSIWAGFDMAAAQQHVEFISQYWRLAAMPATTRRSIRVRNRLRESGFVESGTGAATLRIDTYPSGGRGWDHSVGTVAIARQGQPDRVVLSRERDRLALCINSFSTPAGGIVAPLVDVGRGDREEDYAGKKRQRRGRARRCGRRRPLAPRRRNARRGRCHFYRASRLSLRRRAGRPTHAA